MVSSAVTSNALPKDTNAVYFVLTSADVTASPTSFPSSTNGFAVVYPNGIEKLKAK